MSTKTTEFEVKNSCKILKDAKFVLFQGNKPHVLLKMNLIKL